MMDYTSSESSSSDDPYSSSDYEEEYTEAAGADDDSASDGRAASSDSDGDGDGYSDESYSDSSSSSESPSRGEDAPVSVYATPFPLTEMKTPPKPRSTTRRKKVRRVYFAPSHPLLRPVTERYSGQRRSPQPPSPASTKRDEGVARVTSMYFVRRDAVLAEREALKIAAARKVTSRDYKPLTPPQKVRSVRPPPAVEDLDVDRNLELALLAERHHDKRVASHLAKDREAMLRAAEALHGSTCPSPWPFWRGARGEPVDTAPPHCVGVGSSVSGSERRVMNLMDVACMRPCLPGTVLCVQHTCRTCGRPKGLYMLRCAGCARAYRSTYEERLRVPRPPPRERGGKKRATAPPKTPTEPSHKVAFASPSDGHPAAAGDERAAEPAAASRTGSVSGADAARSSEKAAEAPAPAAASSSRTGSVSGADAARSSEKAAEAPAPAPAPAAESSSRTGSVSGADAARSSEKAAEAPAPAPAPAAESSSRTGSVSGADAARSSEKAAEAPAPAAAPSYVDAQAANPVAASSAEPTPTTTANPRVDAPPPAPGSGGSRPGSATRAATGGGGSRPGSATRAATGGGGSRPGSATRAATGGGGSRPGSATRAATGGGGSRPGSAARGDSNPAAASQSSSSGSGAPLAREASAVVSAETKASAAANETLLAGLAEFSLDDD